MIKYIYLCVEYEYDGYNVHEAHLTESNANIWLLKKQLEMCKEVEEEKRSKGYYYIVTQRFGIIKQELLEDVK